MSFSSREFRSALGCFATGITVITAAPRGHAPFGLTANSFTSLSLEPPLVLWCLDEASETREAFTAAEHFTVNILAEDQTALSQAFARKNAHEIGDVPHRLSQEGVPILEGALAHFECAVAERLAGGDHIIYVGRVLRFASRAGRPLLYAGGAYRRLHEL